MAVQTESMPETLEITAVCDDEIVMATQHKNLPIFSVQFHPESYMSEFGEQVLQNWLNFKNT